ncbi:MAG: hypothetical protein FJW39_34225 [Acidobacteria bacterium]|nr:hypothetical protein [Acidobacteriota bacterium]
MRHSIPLAAACLARSLTAAPLPAPAKIPLLFEANQGQAPAPVHFVGRAGPGVAEVESNALTIDGIRMRFAGASAGARVRGVQPLESHTSYFTGDLTIPRAPHFSKVEIEGLYPGIDAVVHGPGRQFEYDFVVAPHADPARIRIEFPAGVSLRLEDGGDFVARQGDAEIRHRKPSIYQQEDGGARRSVEGGFVVSEGNAVTFRIGRYDRAKPLVIDPVVRATFFGGTDFEFVAAIALDGAGNVYIAGVSSSRVPGTAGVLKPANDGADVFVAKFTPDLSRLT